MHQLGVYEVACKLCEFIHNNLVEKDIKILDCLLKEYVGSSCDPFLTLLNYVMGIVKCDLPPVTFVQREFENKKWLHYKKKTKPSNKCLHEQGIADIEAMKANQTKPWYFLGSWSLSLIHKNEARSTCNRKERL